MTAAKLRVVAASGVVALILLCVWMVYKGSERTYYAVTLIRLTRGDAILRDDRLVGGYFYWGGVPFSAHTDGQGSIYIGVERKHNDGILVFHPDGTYDREIVLRAWPDGRRPVSFYTLGVSPSGNRLWAVLEPNRVPGLPPHNGEGLLRVSAYDLQGNPQSLWILPDNGIEQFGAAGEDAAYLWDGKYLQVFKLGFGSYSTRRLFSTNPVFVDDGWVWGVDSTQESGRSPGYYNLRSRYLIEIWRQKPGQERLVVRRTTLPFPHAMLFSRGNSENLYMDVPSMKRRDARKLDHSVYRIPPEGEPEALFDASDLLDRDERSGAFLHVGRDGSVVFETDDTPYGQSVLRNYRIRKAVPTQRWRVWLRKLGIE